MSGIIAHLNFFKSNAAYVQSDYDFSQPEQCVEGTHSHIGFFF